MCTEDFVGQLCEDYVKGEWDVSGTLHVQVKGTLAATILGRLHKKIIPNFMIMSYIIYTRV